MNELLPAIEFETAANPRASVIWLHGLGADGNDFVSIVPELNLPKTSGVRFLFPHAPMRPVTINNGFVMRAWYDVSYQDFVRKEDETGVRESQQAIENLLAREKQRGVPPERIVIAGFSQGGAIALQVGLRYPERLAGLMVLSSYLPLADSAAAEASAANKELPIFMAHGSYDPLLPLTLGLASRRRLEQLGNFVEWHEYPMPHSVCLEEINDAGAWLRKVLSY